MIGYYFAYRSIYAAEGGYQLSRRQLTAVVAAGFSGLFSTGGIRPDGLVLQASGASRREAMVRVTTLTGMEQGILALYGCAASIAWWLNLRASAGIPVRYGAAGESRTAGIRLRIAPGPRAAHSPQSPAGYELLDLCFASRPPRHRQTARRPGAGRRCPRRLARGRSRPGWTGSAGQAGLTPCATHLRSGSPG